MTAMITHTPSLKWPSVNHSGFWRNSLAASLAVALHALVLALLVHGWSVAKPAVEPPKVLTTRLVMVSPAAPPQASEPLPVPAAVAPTPPEPTVATPVKPLVDPQVQAQNLEQAALARKRVEDRKQHVQAEQQRQRLASEKSQREAQEQRLANEQAQQAQHAEKTRLAADRARQQAAQAVADSRQYLPLSKEAPDYPQRALDKNIEGDCTVEYTVNPQGLIEHPTVLEGCHPMFMRPSLAAANTFRYQPRIIDGRAVAVPAVRNTFHYRIK